MEIKKNNIEIRKNWNKFTFKKLGAVFCLFLFGVVAFVSGNLSQVNAASSSTVLPVVKGGTGANTLSSGQALIGNGANSLQTKPIDTSPQSNSTNLITSGAVKTIADNSALAKGYDNTYFVNSANNDSMNAVYLIGPVAAETGGSPNFTNFFAQIILYRVGSSQAFAANSEYYVSISSAYSNANTNASVNLLGKSGYNRTVSAVTFSYNNTKYLGLLISNGSISQFIIKGHVNTSLNCVSNSGLCTGRMFYISEISNITTI